MSEGVPTVDFRAVGGPDHAAAVRAIGDALATWGFVAITHHGIDPDLLARAYGEAEALFALPDAAKRAYETPGDGRQRGYTSFGVEHAKDNPAADLKEFWHVGRAVEAGGALPVNQAPSERPDFLPTMVALFDQTEAFALRLASVIAEHLNLPADFFASRVEGGNSVLRIIHYPPVEDPVPGQVRAAAHEDINLLTVLPVSTAPGLELQTRDGTWMAVTPPPGAVLCDTGDMMQLLTGGSMPATTHRVVNPPTGNRSSRYSMPFFMHPAPTVCLDPVVGDADFGGFPKGITAGDYLSMRLKETGVA